MHAENAFWILKVPGRTLKSQFAVSTEVFWCGMLRVHRWRPPFPLPIPQGRGVVSLPRLSSEEEGLALSRRRRSVRPAEPLAGHRRKPERGGSCSETELAPAISQTSVYSRESVEDAGSSLLSRGVMGGQENGVGEGVSAQTAGARRLGRSRAAPGHADYPARRADRPVHSPVPPPTTLCTHATADHSAAGRRVPTLGCARE